MFDMINYEQSILFPSESFQGQTCTDTSQCSTANTECTGGTCQCMAGYYDTNGVSRDGNCESMFSFDTPKYQIMINTDL